MSRKSNIAIVVLNWNGADDAIACISSLLKQRPTVPDIIIVDNNSKDDSVRRFQQFIAAHPNDTIRLITNRVNSGFAGGNNLGFRHALRENYSYIGTLNPDATADASWVDSLVNELSDHKDTGIATGMMVRADKTTLDTTGEIFSTWGLPSPRGRDLPVESASPTAEYIFGSTGGGFIARRELLEKVGFFDERFFMYYEDVDLCFRSQLAGFRVRYTPQAIAYHKVSESTKKVPGLAIYNTFKNLPLLIIKNVPTSLLLTVFPRFLLVYCLILGSAIRKGAGRYALHGVIKSIGNIPYSLRSRRAVQGAKAVSDSYIKNIMLHDIPHEQANLRRFRKLFIGR